VGNNPERVVFDTNVLVSAVAFGGKPRELLTMAAEGLVAGVTSPYVLWELRTVLVRSHFRFEETLAVEFSEQVARTMEVVAVGRPRGNWVTDPDDNAIVETALAGHAPLIVTGDRRLLAAEIPGIEVVTVTAMLLRVDRAL
jgi:putative PIN family toxin of toxin-antitoxin system